MKTPLKVPAFVCAALACISFNVLAQKAGTETYTYDALGRLQGVLYPSGVSVTYSYDAAGNRKVVASSKGPGITASGWSTSITLPLQLIPNGGQTVCGGSTTASVTGVTGGTGSGYTYVWSGGFTLTNATSAIVTISYASAVGGTTCPVISEPLTLTIKDNGGNQLVLNATVTTS